MRVNESYFSRLLPNPQNIATDSQRYPYRLSTQMKKIAQAKEQFESFKSCCEGLTVADLVDNYASVSEALGDGQQGTGILDQGTINPFIPQVFTDTIVQLNNRQDTLANLFTTVNQATGSQFSHRYYVHTESGQILQEGDTILHARSRRRADTFRFNKVASSSVFTRELLADSSVSEIALSMAANATRVNQLSARLASHEFYYLSDANLHADFHAYNWMSINSDSGSITTDNILDAMESAFLKLTTERQEQQMSPSELTWIMSPGAFVKIFRSSLLRQYNVSGLTNNQITGAMPNWFGVPRTIVSALGYFDADNVWQYDDDAIILCATDCCAQRVRQSMQIEPLILQSTQQEGFIMSSRFRYMMINPLRFIRISNNASTDIKLASDITYTIRDLAKSEDADNLVTINT